MCGCECVDASVCGCECVYVDVSECVDVSVDAWMRMCAVSGDVRVWMYAL